MRKETAFNLFGLTFHFYPSPGCSILCRTLEACDCDHKVPLAYKLFFVLNFLGVGFAVSNHGVSLKQKP